MYLTVYKQMTGVKLFVLQSNTWNYLTVCKQTNFGSFKDVIYKTNHIHLIYMYKQDLTSNNFWKL